MNEGWETLHFKIGGGLNNLARDAFWYEQKFEWARNVFRCFQGITEEQINKILAGEARIEPIDDGDRVALIFKEDKKFKTKLAEHMEFIIQEINHLQKEIHHADTAIEGIEFKYVYKDDYDPKVGELGELKEKLEKSMNDFQKALDWYEEIMVKKIDKKRLDLTTNIGGSEMPNTLLDDYLNNVVRRLRMAMKTGSLLYEDPLVIVELEQRRKSLHDKIIDAVGLGKANRKGMKYHGFAVALEEFLESMGAGLK